MRNGWHIGKCSPKKNNRKNYQSGKQGLPALGERLGGLEAWLPTWEGAINAMYKAAQVRRGQGYSSFQRQPLGRLLGHKGYDHKTDD